MLRLFVLAAVFAASVLPRAGTADIISHFGGGYGSDVPSLLDSVGIGRGNSGAERLSQTFFLPGTDSDTLDLTFELVRDTGGFNFSFGFFDMATPTADPTQNRQEWATQALSGATLVFDDRIDNPGATETIFNLKGGTELGFFLIPNNSLANFQTDPASFFADPATSNALRAPLFSVSAANPGGLDQMLSFVANDTTLFTFEDLTRTGGSDQDFTDLAFTVDAALDEIPTPGPSATAVSVPPPLVLLGSGVLALGLLFRRRRHQARAQSTRRAYPRG